MAGESTDNRPHLAALATTLDATGRRRKKKVARKTQRVLTDNVYRKT